MQSQPPVSNPWFDKDRSETDVNRTPDVLKNGFNISNPALGISVYNNAIPAEQSQAAIDTLEAKLSGALSMYGVGWSGARVTNSDEADTTARNALDFKIGSTTLGPRNQFNEELYDMHEGLFQIAQKCMDEYGERWGVGIRFFESFNFVKYDGPGTHFKIHVDHGPTYVSTISMVMYLNDDYEGGEIFFPRFNLTIKPKKGDIVIFPSTYIYEHSSLDMVSGVKYAVVVMTDYNDRNRLNQRVNQTIQTYELNY
jgi:2OG-Fe(II) oxygenase superfamily